ncbi:hypothetical protein CLCR_05223 [Cladophialophora carrionii]|uniref:Uncharacterized protein n=1 Tax=Cladophialophora carrionii TaxID=86049 RepID=A0A1C1CKM5_9EURO|nr:hypothetical protein CLCR_05223 [Cladophialophora carrionii]
MSFWWTTHLLLRFYEHCEQLWMDDLAVFFDCWGSLVTSRARALAGRTWHARAVYRAHSIGAEDNRVTEIEDVYLGEDGSIQCVVAWKPSLIAIDSIIGRELRRRCEQHFEMRYGQKELQRRTAAIKRQTKKE